MISVTRYWTYHCFTVEFIFVLFVIQRYLSIKLDTLLDGHIREGSIHVHDATQIEEREARYAVTMKPPPYVNGCIRSEGCTHEREWGGKKEAWTSTAATRNECLPHHHHSARKDGSHPLYFLLTCRLLSAEDAVSAAYDPRDWDPCRKSSLTLRPCLLVCACVIKRWCDARRCNQMLDGCCCGCGRG